MEGVKDIGVISRCADLGGEDEVKVCLRGAKPRFVLQLARTVRLQTRRRVNCELDSTASPIRLGQHISP